jgi:GT2 family glycosyltransferase
MKGPGRVSVVMVTYNGLGDLEESLSTLHDQSRPPDEIVVVDNGSTDGTVAFIRANFPTVRLLAEQVNHGFAKGNNIGVRATTGDYLVFLNQDVRLDHHWLANLIRPLEEDLELAACQSLVMLYSEPNLINTSGTVVNFLGVGWCRDYRKPVVDSRARETASLSGAAFAIRRSAFDAAGGFDDDYFMYHCDVDFSWRLRLILGSRLELAADSVVFHKYRFVRHARKYFLLERNRLTTLLKNYRGGTLVLILPALVVTEVGVCLLAASQGWLRPKLAAYRDLFQRLPNTWRKRRATQRSRQLSDREMLPWLVGTIAFDEIDYPLVRFGGALLAGYWWVIRRLIVW